MIGKTVYKFDQNHRVYHLPDGTKLSSPIYREYWRPRKVVSETSRSWITEYGEKIPKRGDQNGWELSLRGVENDVWVNDNRHKLADQVRKETSVTKLRQIDGILNPAYLRKKS